MKLMKSRLALLGYLLLLSGCGLWISACSRHDPPGNPQGKVRVTVTTGMIADTVRNIGGDRVQVDALMGPGVDPHLYKASEGDISRLSEADIIFYNGLNLEGKMGDILVKIARRGKPVIAVSEAIDQSLLREPPELEGHPDPHIWFDVSLWMKTLPVISNALIEIDPEGRSIYEANTKTHQEKLTQLHDYCLEQIATIPKEQRVLITAHDAFGYFGRAYDIEVVGLQGISTVSEYGLKDIQRLVELIAQRKIKAVFVESSVPKRSIEAVVAGVRQVGHQVTIGGELFSDAMGAAGTPEGTYEGMVRHNVDTIVKSLK